MTTAANATIAKTTFGTNRSPTQADAILAALEQAQGQWVRMPDLWRASGAFAVHSRVAELRARGHMIDNKIERGQDGAKQSWYRLTH